MANEIKCPKCGSEVTVDEAIVQKMVNLKVQKSLEEERPRLHTELKSEMEKEQSQTLKTIQEKLEDSRKKELDSIKKQTELEDKLKIQELETARKIQEERKLILEKMEKDIQFKYEIQIQEMQKKLEDTQKAVREAERKAHQGSMQTQGEVLELNIEDTLKQNFPLDKIEPVPKGISGADIIQIVYGPSNQPAGKIAWETKRTKNWTEEWVQKLKDDSRSIHADLSILLSDTLPKEISNFGNYKGIWVCNYSLLLGVASIMRSQLIAVSSATTAETGKDQKMEEVYNYLTSNSFAQKIQALVETFDNMKQCLDSEKRAMVKNWAQRETQIMRLAENTAKMYGQIQGIAGAALPTINLLELESAKEESTEVPI
ncbi:MAG: DUF2130 domain-containing protein [bacterium]|nr:DUF2130 domain-containing protein [bacterium]